VNDETDCSQLIPQLEQVKANTSRYPDELSADNSYYTEENLMYLVEKRIDGYIPDENTIRKIKGKSIRDYQKEELKYNDEGDYFECQFGRITFRYNYFDRSKGKEVWIYKGENCRQCPSQSSCVKNRKGIKVVKCIIPEKIRIEMLNRVRSEEGIKKYNLRRKLEKVFGHFKLNLGLRQFLTRGLRGVRVEFDLACIAYNLKRIWNSM